MRLLLAASSLALLVACGSEEAERPTAEGAVAAFTAQNQDGATDASTEPADVEAEAQPVPEPEGSLATREMALGSEDAPLTIVEYASVTCPACAMFHEQVLPGIKEEFVDTGKVRFVFREFPTSPIQLSYVGSILARCSATDTGSPAYFTMLNALFERQRDWVYGSDPAGALQDIFSQAGLDRPAIEDCLRREAIIETVNANVAAGTEAGVKGTPTLMIDGEEFDWRRDPASLKQAIQAEVDARS